MDIQIHLLFQKPEGFYQNAITILAGGFIGLILGSLRRYPGWKRDIKTLFYQDIWVYTFTLFGLFTIIGAALIDYDMVMDQNQRVDPDRLEWLSWIGVAMMYLYCGYASACYDMYVNCWLVREFEELELESYTAKNFIFEMLTWPWGIVRTLFKMIKGVVRFIWRAGRCPGEV
jgi:hypothetical protein